jgi:hypothetical protein
MTHHSGRAALPTSDEERERLKQREGFKPEDIKFDTTKTIEKTGPDFELGVESEQEVDPEFSNLTKNDEMEIVQEDIMGTTTNLSELERKIEAIQKYTEEQDSDQTDELSDDFQTESMVSSGPLDTGRSGEINFKEQKIMGMPETREQLLGKVDLEWGGAYIISSKDPEFGLNILNNFSKKSSGQYLSITRTHPKKLNSNLLPETKNGIWLSKSSGDNTVAPGNISKLSHIIHDFLKVNEKGIIFLDGVEYLINNNDFPKILKFIEMIHEKIVLSNGILLIPVNPSALPKNNLDLLENELSNKIEDSGFGDDKDWITEKPVEGIEGSPKLEGEISTEPLGVRVATKAELKALCKKLGLNTSGTVEDLKKRLMEYEEYSAEAVKEAESDSKSAISKKKGKSDSKMDQGKVSEKELRVSGSVDITDKERAVLTAIAEERKILESLLSERKRLEDDISKLRQAERKQKMQLERQKILEERGKLKRDKRELEDERKKLEKRLRLTIKQVAEAQKPVELPDKIDKIDKIPRSKSTSKHTPGKSRDDKEKIRGKDVDLRDIDNLLSKTSGRTTASGTGVRPGARGSGKLKVLKEPKKPKGPGGLKSVPGKYERNLPEESSVIPNKDLQRVKKLKPQRSTKLTKPTKTRHQYGKQKIDKTADEKRNLLIKPRFNLDNIEEYAMKHLKSSILGKPLEVIKDIKLIFLPLFRIHVKTMRGTIFAKEYTGTFYWDTVTGEIITDVGNVLKRSKGLAMLMSLTPSQAKVLANLDTWGYDDVVDLEGETNMSVTQIKRTLTALQKKSLVVSERQSDKRIYSYKRMVELKYPQKFDKVKVDMHQIIKGNVDTDIISSQFKIKDLEKLLLSLKPGTRLVSEEEIFYPYFKIDIIGRQGPRTVILDSFSGSQDIILTEYLDIKGLS